MKQAKLYMVGVPIGNYDDMTFRAVETLKNVDAIAAEDTRKAKRLLSHFVIKPNELFSHGSHNEHSSVQGIVNILQQGKSVALITDAGMPGISDPGYLLVRGVLEAGIEIETIPGVTAVTTALSVSGITCDRFCFQGFLPRQKKAITDILNRVKNYPETIVFYEAPHRILATLDHLLTSLGNRQVCIGRELTKTYQEFIRNDLESVIVELKSREEILGEFTIVVEGVNEADIETDFDLDAEIKTRLGQNMHIKDISAEIAKKHGLSKKEVYQKCLELKD